MILQDFNIKHLYKNPLPVYSLFSIFSLQDPEFYTDLPASIPNSCQ
jgi:hypothetical protein